MSLRAKVILPVLIATTPFFRSKFVCCAMKLVAPLNLKEPDFCKFSHLKKNPILRSVEDAASDMESYCNMGVRLMSGCMTLCAARTWAIEAASRFACCMLLSSQN